MQPSDTHQEPKKVGETSERGGRRGGDRRSGGDRRGGRRQSEPREYEQKILDLARVTRVTAGGKRMTFRCALVIGNKKGRVGFGVAKGADVQVAVERPTDKQRNECMIFL